MHEETWGVLRLFNVLTFRADGLVDAIDQYTVDGDVARSTYVYDEKPRLVEIQFRSTDGGLTRTVHVYDGSRLARTARIDAQGESHEHEVCRYDAAGRKTAVQRLDAVSPGACYSIDGSERAYGAPGAVSLTVNYDEHDRAIEAVFRDDADAVVRRVTFTRDEDGKLVREEVSFGGGLPFPMPDIEQAAEADRTRLAALMASVFGGGVFSTASYRYDDRGRLVERIETTGQLSDERETFRYDDHGNLVEQASETRHRQIDLDESGAPRATAEAPIEQRNVFEYVYDAHGNWTERVLSYRHPSTGHWQHSNIERREITYDG